MANRLNISSLVDAVITHDAFADAPKYKIEDVVRTIFTTIETAVVNGDKVAIPGFGTFTKFTSGTSGKSKPKFSGSKLFKDKLN